MSDPAPAAPGDELVFEGGDGSRLCLACGICCSGTLFHFADLQPGEERLRRLLPIIDHPTTPDGHFELPCPRHDRERGCTLYEDRPRTCATYACALLRRLEEGAIDLADALAVVDGLWTLIRRVDAALPPGKFLWDRARALHHLGPPSAAAERREHAGTLLDLKVLELLLVKHLDERVAREASKDGPTAASKDASAEAGSED